MPQSTFPFHFLSTCPDKHCIPIPFQKNWTAFRKGKCCVPFLTMYVILVTFYIRLQLLHTLFEVQRSVRERKNPQMCRHNEVDAYIFFSLSEPCSGVCFIFPRKTSCWKKGSTYTLILMHLSNSDITCYSCLPALTFSLHFVNLIDFMSILWLYTITRVW